MDIVILAAGKGKRMKSSIPKVLHLFRGKEFILHLVEKCQSIEHRNVYIVIQSIYKSHFESILRSYSIHYIYQDIPQGTGHALQCFMSQIKEEMFYDVLILNGDVPNINISIIQQFIFSKANVLVSYLSNPKGYGRVKLHLDNYNNYVTIIEEKDNCENISLCNLGIYRFSYNFLKNFISKLNTENNQREYYITDLFLHLKPCHYFLVDEKDQKYFLGVNTIDELKYLETLDQ